MKSVLIISPFSSTFYAPLRRAFRFYGFQTASIDYRGNIISNPDKIIHRLIKVLPIYGRLKKYAKQAINRKIIKVAEEIKPAFIFAVKAPTLYPDTLSSLKKICPTVNYYCETMDQWDLIKKIAPQYTLFANHDPYVVEMLKKEDCKSALYIPFSADLSESDQWIKPEKYLYNLSFIGTYDPNLYSEREYILNKIKDLGLHLWGSKNWLNTSLRNCYKGRVKTENIQEIYKNSKIVINADISREVLGIGVNLRPFEAAAAGAMLLNRDDRKDIFNLFEDGKEFVSFSGVEDVRQKAQYYLEHEEERLKIAEAGFNRAKNDHTYIKRVGEIIKAVNL